jgi:hypothetical protein
MEREGPIHRFLARDHTRLDELLRRSVADPAVVDMAAYETFRSGLLRHIAMEEKVLIPDPGGLYDVCEGLAGAGAGDLLARIEAVPEVPTAAHVDGPRVHERIANLFRARAARER